MKLYSLIIMICIPIACQAGWEISVVYPYGDVGKCTSIALDSSENPCMTYSICTGPDMYDYDLRYSRWLGDTWDTMGAGSGAFWNSLAIDSSDNPHVSATIFRHDDLNPAHNYFDGAEWHHDQIASTESEWHSIELDDSENPRVFYYDVDETSLDYAHLEGVNWVIDTVDNGGDIGGSISTAIDISDNVHIIYVDNSSQQLKYAYQNGSSWVISNVNTSIDVSSVTSIVLDSFGNPHISFYDEDNSDLIYAYLDSSWQIETVDSSGDKGEWSSIALDSSDNPHISYYGDGDLMYAYDNGSTWEIEIVDSDGDVGLWNSLVLDSSNNPHISYRDNTDENVKYAVNNSTDIDEEEGDIPDIPTGFVLFQSVPNPSCGNFIIKFAVPYKTDLELQLFDVKGRKVDNLTAGSFNAGVHSIPVRDIGAGVYLYRLSSGEFVETKVLVVY